MLVLTNDQISSFQLLVIATGLSLWGAHKIKVNKNFKPTKMVEFTNKICGTNFERTEYMKASVALTEEAHRRARREKEEELRKKLFSN